MPSLERSRFALILGLTFSVFHNILLHFQHAWHAYGPSTHCSNVEVELIKSPERDAMGDDEYHPISHGGSNLTKAGGIGYMIVDVLDSLQLMGLDEEYSRARSWVTEKLSFDQDDSFSLFEVYSLLYRPLITVLSITNPDYDTRSRRPPVSLSSFQ